jgi:regulation of enolase protein 1 (concanavalin A-like superfamily)
MRAPRLLLPISDAFAAEAWVSPVEEKPQAAGGLLLWRDEDNFLCLAHEGDKILFQGNADGKWYLFGQGLWKTERTLLRLERSGNRVGAYCSMDGENWLSLGEAAFAVEEPVQVGLFAAGWHGFPLMLSDAAIRFSGVRIGHPLG